MSLRFDVVVVGAGTAGAYLAYLLARSGLSVALVELRMYESLYKFTGDAIGEHHLKRHGIEVPSNVIDNRYVGAEIYSPSEQIRYFISGRGLSLNMHEWSRWLVKRAVNSGAMLLDGHQGMKPIVSSNSVVGVVVKRMSDGTKHEIYSKVTVDATGATGTIRTRVPETWLIREPLRPDQASYAYREIVELDEEVEGHDRIRIYLNVSIAPGGYWWYFPKWRSCVNVGLGIWGKLVRERGLSPVEHYVKYVRPRLCVKNVVNAGGGIVPTRRPLASMVDNGILAVGDAALAVNPVHGGGLGPGLLSSSLACRTILRAFEVGSFSRETLWTYNLDYMREYGIKQAKLDVFRIMLQTLSNDEIEAGLRAGVLSEKDVADISGSGRAMSLWTKIKILIKLLRMPSLAEKLLLTARYMRKVERLYRAYPERPDRIQYWISEVERLYGDYERQLRSGLTKL